MQRSRHHCAARFSPCALAAILTAAILTPALAQNELILLDDAVLDGNALLMPRNATYGRAINGIAYQTEALLTVGDYQYTAWYHLGGNEDVYLARRNLAGGNWEVMDTGENFVNGDGNAWDAHNIISMGISGDGAIHLAWDHHGHNLRYMSTAAGAATAATWDATLFDSERSSLNLGGPSIGGVTYPRFVTDPHSGDMLFAYRTGGSGNGVMNLATYVSDTGVWDTPHAIITGASGITYTDPVGTSNSRNAYLNGIDFDSAGRIHTTWTWRESAGGTNHDINYAYSDDGGTTWRNGDGASVGNLIDLNSPGIVIDDGNPGNGQLGEINRLNTLMNQQTQTVDRDGRVHAIMWHADDANANSVSSFTTGPAAYYHYFRDATKTTIYADDFSGTGGTLNGTTEDHQGALWSANAPFLDNSELDESVEGSALLNFQPVANATYELSLDVLNPTDRWVGLGFARDPIQDPGADSFQDRFSNDLNAVGWMLYRDSATDADDIQLFGGLATSGPLADNHASINFNQFNSLKVVLDTTGDGSSFTVDYQLDQGAGFVSLSDGPQQVNIPLSDINYAGISFDDSTTDDVQIDNFSLTQVDYAWQRRELPTSRAVGSRPDMAFDENGNLYAVYVSPGEGDGVGVLDYYTDGDLVIASASKASGYEDWRIVYTDTRDFAGEPRIDQGRLTTSGIVSVYVQENDDLETGVTGTPLHVLEFAKLANNVVWAGDDTQQWQAAAGSDWDNDNDNRGDTPFESGWQATFDDGASTFAVDIAEPVAPSATIFRNTPGNPYTLTGASITGTGSLSVVGGGRVTLSNGPNTYTGATVVSQGTLALTGNSSIASSASVRVDSGASLDVTAAANGLTLNSQPLVIDGQVQGNVTATTASTVQVNSTNAITGNLTLESGSQATGAGSIGGSVTAHGGILRVGAAGMASLVEPSVAVVDDFNTEGLGQYVSTVVLDNWIDESNVTFSDSSGALVASYAGSFNQPEQVVLLRDDVSLAIGDKLSVDVDMGFTGQQMDFGLAIATTAAPSAASAGNTDTRDQFEWSSVSIRPSGNNIRVNQSVGGTVDTSSGTITGTSEVSVAALYIKRNSATEFTLGYTDTSLVDHDAEIVTFSSADAATAIGFYTDLRFSGSLGDFDNLQITSASQLTYLGETLAVAGDLAMDSTTRLELDIATPTQHDRLAVGGLFSAAGTLSISLEQDASSPQLGDTFDILAFSTATGGFDNYQLPGLAAGLGWDVSQLLVSGELAIGLTGDYNSDGQVDAADYIVWRDNLGAATLSNRDTQLAGMVGVGDYFAWQANYGASLGSLHTLAEAVVPEPTTGITMLSMMVLLAVRVTVANRSN